MNKAKYRTITAYSYTEQGDYKIMRRPDLAASFYDYELKHSDEPQFLYELSIPFPNFMHIAFYGAWEGKSLTLTRIEFIKAEPMGDYMWLIYVKFVFLESEDTPVFKIPLQEGVDGVVFKKTRVVPKPE